MAAAAPPAAAPTSILAPQEPLKPPEDEQYTVHVPEGLRMQVLFACRPPSQVAGASRRRTCLRVNSDSVLDEMAVFWAPPC